MCTTPAARTEPRRIAPSARVIECAPSRDRAAAGHPEPISRDSRSKTDGQGRPQDRQGQALFLQLRQRAPQGRGQGDGQRWRPGGEDREDRDQDARPQGGEEGGCKGRVSLRFASDRKAPLTRGFSVVDAPAFPRRTDPGRSDAPAARADRAVGVRRHPQSALSQRQPAGGWSIDRCRVEFVDAGACSDLSVEWSLLEASADGSPFTSWAWVSTWLKHLPASVRPVLCRIHDGHGLLALGLLVRVPERGLRKAFGSYSMRLQETGDEVIDEITPEYVGLLVRRGREIDAYAAFFEAISQRCRGWRRIQVPATGHGS